MNKDLKEFFEIVGTKVRTLAEIKKAPDEKALREIGNSLRKDPYMRFSILELIAKKLKSGNSKKEIGRINRIINFKNDVNIEAWIAGLPRVYR